MKNPGERGITAVEFALLLPLVALILFGIIEFGLILYDQAVITNASRDGARAGIVFGSNTINVRTAVNADITRLVTFGASSNTVNISTNVDGTIYPNSGCPNTTPANCITNPARCSYLTVTITYPYTSLMLGHFAGRNLTATTIMRCE